MKKAIQPVVISLIKKENKYLFTLRTENDPEDKDFHNIWQIPGGGLKFGESIEGGLKREAKEEIGIDITITKFLGVWESIRHNWHGLLLCYLCKMSDETDPIKLNKEASEYKWLTADEIKDIYTFPETYKIVIEAEKISGRERT